MKLKILVLTVLLASVVQVSAHSSDPVSDDTAMVLPFENTSGRTDLNWIGESFAEALPALLQIPGVSTVSNSERRMIQRNLGISLSSLPSLAASLKMAREAKASLLITGKYELVQNSGTAVELSVTAKVVRVGEGKFLVEQQEDGAKRIVRELVFSGTLENLQAIQGEMAYQILLQRDKKGLGSAKVTRTELARKVAAQAFEAYVKGLLASDSEAQSKEGYFRNALNINLREKQEIYYDAALELGHMYLDRLRFGEALTYFSMLTDADPKVVGPKHAEAAFYSGLIFWKQANFDQALAIFKLLAEDLKIPTVYNTVGAMAVHASRLEKKDNAKSTGLLDDGIKYLRKAVQASPQNADALFNLGLALVTGGKYADSVQYLRAYLKTRSQDGDGRFLLAKALGEMRDADAVAADNEAMQLLTKDNRYAALQTEWLASKTAGRINVKILLPPRKDFVSVVLVNKNAFQNRSALSETDELLAKAREYFKARQYDEAMETLRRVLFTEQMNPESYYLMGMIYLERGDFDQALTSFRTSIFWDIKYFDPYVPLVKIHIERNDCLQARNYFQAAKGADPQREELASLQRQVDLCSK